jgi:hypothetical protein
VPEPRPPHSPGRSRRSKAALSRGGEHSEALKSSPTPHGARSFAGRPHSAIPGGPSRCSPVRARRPMLLAVQRVTVGCSFAVQAHPHPSSLKAGPRHTLRPAGAPAARKCRPPAPGRAAAASPVFPGRLSQLSCPPPPLAPTIARRLAPSSHRAAASPEQGSQRPPAGCATVCSCQRDLNPNQAPESNLGESLVVFPTFPGRPQHRSHPIPASRAALHARDYIASFSFFPG